MGKKLAALSTAIVALMGGMISNISPVMATDWTFQEVWENKLKLDSESNCNLDFNCESNFYIEQRLLSDLNKSTRIMNENSVLITAFNIDTGTVRIMFNNHSIQSVWRNKLESIPERLALLKIRWFYEGSEPKNFNEYFEEDREALNYEVRNSELIVPNQEVEIKLGEPIKDGKKLTTYQLIEYALIDGHSTTKVTRSALNCARTSSLYEYGKECQLYYPTDQFGEYRLMWPEGMEPKEPETGGPTDPGVGGQTDTMGGQTDPTGGKTDPTDGGSSSGSEKDDENESGKGPEGESGDHGEEGDHDEDRDGDRDDGGSQTDDDPLEDNGLTQGSEYSGQNPENANNSGNNDKSGQLNSGVNQGLANNNSPNITNLSQIGAPNTGTVKNRDARDKSTKQDFFELALFIVTFMSLNLTIFIKNGIKMGHKAKK